MKHYDHNICCYAANNFIYLPRKLIGQTCKPLATHVNILILYVHIVDNKQVQHYNVDDSRATMFGSSFPTLLLACFTGKFYYNHRRYPIHSQSFIRSISLYFIAYSSEWVLYYIWLKFMNLHLLQIQFLRCRINWMLCTSGYR